MLIGLALTILVGFVMRRMRGPQPAAAAPGAGVGQARTRTSLRDRAGTRAAALERRREHRQRPARLGDGAVLPR